MKKLKKRQLEWKLPLNAARISFHLCQISIEILNQQQHHHREQQHQRQQQRQQHRHVVRMHKFFTNLRLDTPYKAKKLSTVSKLCMHGLNYTPVF